MAEGPGFETQLLCGIFVQPAVKDTQLFSELGEVRELRKRSGAPTSFTPLSNSHEYYRNNLDLLLPNCIYVKQILPGLI